MSAAPNDAVGRYGSGRAINRIEDPLLVRGRGAFVDDAAEPGQLHLSLLRSSHAHARIRSIDRAGAAAMPGVVAVLTGADLAAAGVGPMHAPAPKKDVDGRSMGTPPRLALAIDTVRFAGEALVAVVAATRAQADDARDAIVVDYDELPALADLGAATAAGATQLWPDAEGNIAAVMRHGDPVATAAAFGAATHVVVLDLVNQRLAPTPLEPRGVIVSPDPATGRLTVRMASQMPTAARNTIADQLRLPREQIRVVVGDVGGGFGMKTDAYPEDVVTAFCARLLGRTVRWTAERSDEFLASGHGRDIASRAELALDGDGKVLALRVRSLCNVGAYATNAGVIIQLLIGPWVSTSVYDIATIDLDLRAVLTNSAPTGAYRGAGRPEAIYTIERLMDAAAKAAGFDRVALRRRNLIGPQQMPYRNPMNQVYDSGHFEAILDQGLAAADWDGFEARAAESAARGRLRGRGIATFLEWTSGNAFEERVAVAVEDGMIEIFSATQAMGQGIATSYAQLAVDVFQVPIDRIRIVQGDTDRGTGFGSAGSRSLFTGGTAVQVASTQTVARAQDLAAAHLEAASHDLEYVGGDFRIVGTDRKVGLFELAAQQAGRAIRIDATTSVEGPSWPNGCHVCEVEVDPETGAVAVVAYSSVNDVGRVVNPTIVRGQLAGGVVQGLGQALCEHLVYDPDSAQNVTASFLDYAMPRVDLLPAIRSEMDQSIPCRTNPLGVKGVGELGTIGATPAAVNAVIDALDRAGAGARAMHLQMPLTSEKVWRVLHPDT
jgi:aerobic carbon-monoxide dehydrogenase large subunit